MSIVGQVKEEYLCKYHKTDTTEKVSVNKVAEKALTVLQAKGCVEFDFGETTPGNPYFFYVAGEDVTYTVDYPFITSVTNAAKVMGLNVKEESKISQGMMIGDDVGLSGYIIRKV